MESDAKKVGHKVTHLINKNLINSKLILNFFVDFIGSIRGATDQRIDFESAGLSKAGRELAERFIRFTDPQPMPHFL